MGDTNNGKWRWYMREVLLGEEESEWEIGMRYSYVFRVKVRVENRGEE